MDIDTSSCFRHTTQYQQTNSQNNQWPLHKPNAQANNNKRVNNGSARFTGPKQQRINHFTLDDTSSEQEERDYETKTNAKVQDIEDKITNYEQVNF